MMIKRFLPVMTVGAILLFVLKLNIFATDVEQAYARAQTSGAALNEISPASSGAKKKAPGGHEEPTKASGEEEDPSCEYNGTETRILEKLSQRREALAERSGEIDMRETLLRATESRIEEKIASLKKIETQIQGLLKKHSKMEQAQLDNLVKTYSAMKAKEAARIFNGLEMPVLLSIIERMKPKIMAKVLAKMTPGTAKEITMELATNKKLPPLEG